LIAWDIVWAIVIAGVGGWPVPDEQINSELGGLLTVEAALIIAVLGIVIAGLAIIVSWLTRDYVALLDRTRFKEDGEFFPFWYVGSISVVAVTGSLIGLFLRHDSGAAGERAIFVTTTFLAAYALFASAGLLGFLVNTGRNRALLLRMAKLRGGDAASGES
jgi:hypothetical protein